MHKGKRDKGLSLEDLFFSSTDWVETGSGDTFRRKVQSIQYLVEHLTDGKQVSRHPFPQCTVCCTEGILREDRPRSLIRQREPIQTEQISRL